MKAGQIEVHESGPDFTEVTERLSMASSFWERGRYEWSQPDVVKQTVTDSNVLEPGSTWELRAAARGGGGTDVDMVLNRNFRGGLRGRFGSTMNHLGGKRWWGWYLRRALSEIEKP